MTETEYSKIVAKNLRRIMFEYDKKPVDVCKDLGISKATMSSWMNGTRTPKMPKIDMLCDYFHCTREDIMEPEPQDAVRCPRIPIYGRVAAGFPETAFENIEGYVEISPSLHGEFFSLRVKGNSMSPQIAEDDVLIIKKQDVADNGDIVIAQIAGEDATVKKLIKQEFGITLQPLNPEYPPMYYNNPDSVKILGKVIESRRRY